MTKLHPELQAMVDGIGHLDPEVLDLVMRAYLLGQVHAVMPLDEKQSDKLQEWMKEQDAKVARGQGKDRPYYGAIGGAYRYSNTPTSLGCALVVEHVMTMERINLTNYDEW